VQHATDCTVEPVAPRAAPEQLRDADSVHLGVADMGCPNCGNSVRNALLGCPGVVEVEVDVPGALAQVWYHANVISVEDIVAKVEAAGEGTHHRYLAVPVGSVLYERKTEG